MNSSQDPDSVYREAFLAELNASIESPSSQWPNVRCWTAIRLQKFVREIRDHLAERGLSSRLSNESILKWLTRLGIRRELIAEGERFQLLQLGGSSDPTADPLELLMAVRPQGTICYFSSLAFHSLTTQSVSHHHVAELEEPATESQVIKSPASSPEYPNRVESKKKLPGAKQSRSRLGKLLFRYQEIPFYVSRRSSRLVPGVQIRAYGPQTNLRITNLEQTLLDSLYKPFHCGGPEVIFEAWQEANQLRLIDEEQLLKLLKCMDYPATNRRTAVMYRLIGGTPGRALQEFWKESEAAIDRNSEFANISLLPGFKYTQLDPFWLVYTP